MLKNKVVIKSSARYKRMKDSIMKSYCVTQEKDIHNVMLEESGVTHVVNHIGDTAEDKLIRHIYGKRNAHDIINSNVATKKYRDEYLNDLHEELFPTEKEVF